MPTKRQQILLTGLAIHLTLVLWAVVPSSTVTGLARQMVAAVPFESRSADQFSALIVLGFAYALMAGLLLPWRSPLWRHKRLPTGAHNERRLPWRHFIRSFGFTLPRIRSQVLSADPAPALDLRRWEDSLHHDGPVSLPAIAAALRSCPGEQGMGAQLTLVEKSPRRVTLHLQTPAYESRALETSVEQLEQVFRVRIRVRQGRHARLQVRGAPERSAWGRGVWPGSHLLALGLTGNGALWLDLLALDTHVVLAGVECLALLHHVLVRRLQEGHAGATVLLDAASSVAPVYRGITWGQDYPHSLDALYAEVLRRRSARHAGIREHPAVLVVVVEPDAAEFERIHALRSAPVVGMHFLLVLSQLPPRYAPLLQSLPAIVTSGLKPITSVPWSARAPRRNKVRIEIGDVVWQGRLHGLTEPTAIMAAQNLLVEATEFPARERVLLRSQGDLRQEPTWLVEGGTCLSSEAIGAVVANEPHLRGLVGLLPDRHEPIEPSAEVVQMPMVEGPVAYGLLRQALAVAIAEGSLSANRLDRLWNGRVALDRRKELLAWFRATGILEQSVAPRQPQRCTATTLDLALTLLQTTPWQPSAQSVPADAREPGQVGTTSTDAAEELSCVRTAALPSGVEGRS